MVEKRGLAGTDVAFEKNGTAGLEMRLWRKHDEGEGLLAVALCAETLVLVVILIPREEICQLPTRSCIWLSTEWNWTEALPCGSRGIQHVVLKRNHSGCVHNAHVMQDVGSYCVTDACPNP